MSEVLTKDTFGSFFVWYVPFVKIFNRITLVPGASATPYALGLTDKTSLNSTTQSLKEESSVDIVVNHAGI